VSAAPRFTPETERRLTRAGWTPGAKRPIDGALRALESEGHPVFAVVRELLAGFGGFEIPIRHHLAGDEDLLVLRPEAAVERFFKDLVEEYAERVGRPLCPVGVVFSGNYVLALAEDGASFAGYEDTLLAVATDPIQMLEKLCTGAELLPVPE
jgi:hypothetical protein